MKIFISWSGDISREIAEKLRSWLGQVIQASEPWISSEIEKGKKWNLEISKRLEDSKIGILCLTPDNLESPWILFEAGAISKTNDSHVCALLFNLTPTDITGPLSTFQATRFLKDEVFSLLSTINQKLINSTAKPLEENQLKGVFDTFWPKLETEINQILFKKSAIVKTARSDREIIEECLEILRLLKNNTSDEKKNTTAIELLDYYAEKYAKSKLIEQYEVGTGEYFLDFYNKVKDNPILKSHFGSTLDDYIKKKYDGLPF